MKTRKPVGTTLIVGVLCLFHTTLALGQNLLVNGDFEAGNTGFTSEYKFARLDTGIGSGTYDIVQKPSESHFLGASFGDHTTGTGLMFAANGHTDTNAVIWSQVVSVEKDTAYEFSGWVTVWGTYKGNLDDNPSRLRLSINGIPILSGFQLSNPSGWWQRIETVWNSETSSSATIELRDEIAIQSGNSITLDDLRFELTSGQRTLRIVPTSPGLVGWWPGDGNAKDIAGTNHGILVNASTRPGYVGEAFAFSGQNSYIQIPRSPIFDAIADTLSLERCRSDKLTGFAQIN